MTFYLGKLAFLVVRPSNFLLLMALVGAIGHRRRWARRCLLASLGCVLLVTLLPVGLWATMPLENRFPRSNADPALAHGFIVLGGSILPDITAARRQASFGQAGERYMTLVALARRYPAARIVFSGGIGALGGAAGSEADVVKLFLAEQGVPPGRVELEGEARTTRENALFTKDLVRPREDQRWFLVTSAMHMPRAVGCFRAVGWDVLPWPVDYRTTGSYQANLMLYVGRRLDELDLAAYEWTGLVYYRLLGWTPALLPRP